MRVVPTALPGVFQIAAEPHADARGAFARLYCPRDFAASGIETPGPWQVSLSRNPRCHTLRGMHVQSAPPGEWKLVRAVRGRAYDVVIDLRPDSPRRGAWIATELDAEAMNAVFVPPGCAHGFMTLRPDTDILYQISPLHAGIETDGVRWDDPAFAIAWPAPPALMAPRDAAWPDWPGPQPAPQPCAEPAARR